MPKLEDYKRTVDYTLPGESCDLGTAWVEPGQGSTADVRLGKSAPILLKALKEIVEVARGDDHAGKPKRSLFDNLVDIEKIALDAIARAGAK